MVLSITHDHDQESTQPILLSRSDAFLPFQPTATSVATSQKSTVPSSIASIEGEQSDDNYRHSDDDHDDYDNRHLSSKRKWDQTMDATSSFNTSKAFKQDIRDHFSDQPCGTLSIAEEDDSQDSDDLHSDNKKPGRKPLADEETFEDGDPKVKRKAQNRAAQRAFRERKERYVKELEYKLKQVQDTHVVATHHLCQENHQLRSIIYRLETENAALKGIHIHQGPLSGKPIQQWIDALQQHQEHFASQSAMINLQVPPPPPPSSHHPLILPLLQPQPPHYAPMASMNESFVPTESPTLSSASTSSHNQQRVQYTFSISTPATLRSRHQQQSTNSSSSLISKQSQHHLHSPPTPPRQQQQRNQQTQQQHSPIELVRLYSHEHAMSPPPPPATPHSPATSISTSTHASCSSSSSSSSKAHTPVMDCQVFCDKLQEEVCTNAFDQLLSEPLFDTAGGLNESLGFPHLDEERALSHPNTIEFITHTPSASSPSQEKEEDIFLSGQAIWDRLHRHAHFQQYSSDQLFTLIKSMAKCTHLGPVLTEQDMQAILKKMDQGIFL